MFVLGGENSDECFNSGHIYKHTAGQGWSFEEVAARQGPFGHRTWCDRLLDPGDFLFGLSSLFCRHAVESFYSADMDSDSDSSRDATDSRLPAKLLLFGGETVNP